MNRRGFLGAGLGAAVGGKKAAQVAMNSFQSGVASNLAYTDRISSGLVGQSVGTEYDPQKGWAHSILRMLKEPGSPSISGSDVYLDCDVRALKSVSLTAKMQINQRKSNAREVRASLRHLAEATGLNFLGLSERELLKQLKDFADE